MSSIIVQPSAAQMQGTFQSTPDAPRSSLFTCLACHVAFKSADIQREHYRSDWHRYNLKRKLVELPPVSADVFTQKVLAQKQKAVEDQAAAEAGSHSECKTCRKTYSSENAYQNHLASKKHKEMEAKLKANPRPAPAEKQPKKDTDNNTSNNNNNSNDDVASITSKMTVDMTITDDMTQEEVNEILDRKIETAVRLEPTDCLFCTHRSETFEANVEHMTKGHGFFIPDIEYLVDLEGLIKFLGEKISVANICLYCNGKGRQIRSLEAVRKHMSDKGHCKIPYDTEAEMMEIVDFYDFRSSYPEEQQQKMLAAAAAEDAAAEGVAKEGEEDEDEELGAGGVRLTEDEMELILPSGARLGHRSLSRYYKQNVKPEESRDSVLINKLLTHYTDHMGYDLAVAQTKARSERGQALVARNAGEARWAHKQTSTFKDFRRWEDHKSRVGLKHNWLQKHFREQIL